MLSRILTRLATVWAVGVGGIFALFALANLSDITWSHVDAGAIAAIILGPAAVLWALAWVFKPAAASP